MIIHLGMRHCTATFYLFYFILFFHFCYTFVNIFLINCVCITKGKDMSHNMLRLKYSLNFLKYSLNIRFVMLRLSSHLQVFVLFCSDTQITSIVCL